MESSMLIRLKSQNPEKEYPSNVGQKWTDEEESLLLEELSNRIDIEMIARTHERTIGGINSRRREIAYKLYEKDTSMKEIIMKTKLNEEEIKETINKKKNNPKKSKSISKKEIKFSIEDEITEMKNDIKELKNTMKDLMELIKKT
tara:strand:- start:505 stop:939 length:435 start_codon:yes stop_codon:yes gene_type:complete